MHDVLGRLRTVHDDMATAQHTLRQARDKEVEARAALRVATAKAMLSADCPRPKRGENGVTVADREAWVDSQVHAEWLDAQVAEAFRQAAWDALTVARDQASVVQSLSALMRQEMAMAGTPGTPT